MPHNDDKPFCADQRNKLLLPLLKHLDNNNLSTEGIFEGWKFCRIPTGANGIVFRATHECGECAVKFTARDDRSRADREFHSLAALREAGLNVAPESLFLDNHKYSQPVVVQSWLDGEVTTSIPITDAEWQRLVEHYAAIHTVTPDKTTVPLQMAVLNADSVEACKTLIWNQLNQIPRKGHPPALCTLIQRLNALNEWTWPKVSPALCRVDANTSNFIRRPDAWASVDWENSGWGDPAFEIADLITHPAYLGTTPERWEWVVNTYCNLRASVDQTASTRISLYHKAMLMFWAVRLARMLYEIPRGLDLRLVERPANWEKDIRSKFTVYLEAAEKALSD